MTSRSQPADAVVGAAIRHRRKLLGLTQRQMAELIGVTYQQAHKYESGTNRVSAGRLHRIAMALECEPGTFFAALDKPIETAPTRRMLHLADDYACLSTRLQNVVARLVRELASEATAE